MNAAAPFVAAVNATAGTEGVNQPCGRSHRVTGITVTVEPLGGKGACSDLAADLQCDSKQAVKLLPQFPSL